MYKINLLFIIFVGLLASCYSKPISIITEETIRPPLSLNLPPPIELKNMEFYILKRENALKIFDKLEKNKKAPIIIGMSVEDYKNLAKKLNAQFKTDKFTVMLLTQGEQVYPNVS